MNKGISITLRDEREDVEQREDTYHYEGGIKSYVELLNENKEPIHEEPIYIHQTKDDVEIEIIYNITAVMQRTYYLMRIIFILMKVVRMKMVSNVP